MTLHELLGIDRPLLIFDTETTGPNPTEDRIVELGFIRMMPDGTEKEWNTFINPGIPIPKEATYGNGTDTYPGHGITDEMVKDAPTFAQYVDNFLIGFSNTDFGVFNGKRFDLPLLQAEFARHGKLWSFDDAKIVDAFRIWQVVQGRSLSDASETFLGRKHEGAHRALDDVRVTRDVIVAQLQRFESLPRNLAALHEKCWPKDPNALDPDGKIIWKDGEAVMNFGKNWRGKPLKMMTRKDLSWIASPACSGANPTVKQICHDAMAGKFPQPTLKEITE